MDMKKHVHICISKEIIRESKKIASLASLFVCLLF